MTISHGTGVTGEESPLNLLLYPKAVKIDRGKSTVILPPTTSPLQNTRSADAETRKKNILIIIYHQPDRPTSFSAPDEEYNKVVMAEMHDYMKPMELFEKKDLVTICAPMVRYSKLAFRSLVRQYRCDLCFTPMIISDSFLQSLRARHSDFTTSHADRPLIVQFAASTGEDWAKAAQLVAPHSDGVDLNCGCPQRWAMAEGYGACLIHKPHLLADMVTQTRAALPQSFTVSVKIRLHKDVRRTVELARQIEAAGASFLTVHGRTQDQGGGIPVNLQGIADIKAALSIPVVANGDIRSMDDARRVKDVTGVDGVMCAQGLLENPALFAGEATTPLDCVKEWVRISLAVGTSFSAFHHHLIYMIDKSLSRSERRYFNGLGSTSGVMAYLEEKYMMEFTPSGS